MRARRSCLAVPGSEARFHAKANELATDEIIFDLEDSVPPALKSEARSTIASSLGTYPFARKTMAVRVNAVDTAWHEDDVREIVRACGSRIDCLIIPKAESPDDVRAIDDRLTVLEREHGVQRRIGLELLIESARGLDRVSEIAAASTRTEALVLGPGDLSASLRMPGLSIGGLVRDYPGDFWHYFLARVVVAARAYDLQPIDGPYADLRDADGLRASAERSAKLGYEGKWAIHPAQIEAINAAYTPRAVDVERAKAILAAYAAASERRTGALRLGDEMIDEATRKMAEVLLRRAELLGLAART